MTKMYTVPSGAEVEVSEGNYISTEVSVDLSQIIDTNNEGFLDMLSLYATDTELLMDIDYTLNRIDSYGALIFEVTGDISSILETED